MLHDEWVFKDSQSLSFFAPDDGFLSIEAALSSSSLMMVLLRLSSSLVVLLLWWWYVSLLVTDRSGTRKPGFVSAVEKWVQGMLNKAFLHFLPNFWHTI